MPWHTNDLSTNILCRDTIAPLFDHRFNYRSVLGNINLLKKRTRPEIAYVTHKCNRFSQYPRASHGDSIINLVNYLKATKTQVITLNPKGNKRFEVYTNAHFCGTWYCPTSGNNRSTTKSWTRYTILYAGWPIIQYSNLQTQIAMSTTEEEYIALSQYLRDSIPMMQLMR